jgi:lysophospholipase L1-like esterase
MRNRPIVLGTLTLCAVLLLGVIYLIPLSSPKTEASAKPVITILPLGDSITYGVGSSDKGGYRTFLWKECIKSGYSVRFVGTRSNGPGDIDTYNEGHPGWRIDQISSHVVPWLMLYRPQIILLFIGTNDILQRHDVSHAPERLTLLLDQITSILPKSTLIVASVTPLDNSELYARRFPSFPSSVDFNANIMAYNATIPAIVRAEAAQGRHVQYVDMYDAVPVYDLADGIHPDDDGYVLMANVWYAALTRLLVPFHET